MAVTLHTQRLNSQDGELEVAYTNATGKRKIQHIALKKSESTLTFQMKDVWMNHSLQNSSKESQTNSHKARLFFALKEQKENSILRQMRLQL